GLAQARRPGTVRAAAPRPALRRKSRRWRVMDRFPGEKVHRRGRMHRDHNWFMIGTLRRAAIGPPIPAPPMLRAFTQDLARGLLNLVYPGVCAVCTRPLGSDQRDFCPACRAALLDDPHPTCRRCASTLGPNLPPGDDCPRCRGEPWQFERVLRVGPYEGLRRDVILRMKHSRHEGLAEAVGELWADHAAER